MVVTAASPTIHVHYVRSEPHPDAVLRVKRQGKEAVCLR